MLGTKKIPRFKSRQEEAEFWDTHDTTEFEDEFVEVHIKVASRWCTCWPCGWMPRRSIDLRR
jgi:hypothetical protein